MAERADIDHFFVLPGGIERRISHKKNGCSAEPPPEARPISGARSPADKPVLSDAQIDQIAKLTETAERLFTGPQDIEGVVTADSAIDLVQVRPAVRPRTVSPSVEWTNDNLTESFPGVTTAMTYSHARTFYRMSFRDFYCTVGVPGAGNCAVVSTNSAAWSDTWTAASTIASMCGMRCTARSPVGTSCARSGSDRSDCRETALSRI